jgi:AAA family ATP:ADP antiporter
LFNTSIFWCLMADTFNSEQAKRMFGFIGVGGTLGSITGSATAALATHIGAVTLLLVSAALLELGVLTVLRFPMREGGSAPMSGRKRLDASADGDVIGGRVWAGFTHVLNSPYLLGICGFMLLFTIGATFLYFAQSDLVGRAYADRATRTAVLAKLELAVQTLTVLTQIFLTGRIIRWLGLAATLAILPVLSVVGFAALGAFPVFAMVAVFTVLRRGGNFAVTNPAMEVLFTVVKREDKYKAKNVIETVVYRSGDQIGGWTYSGLAALGLTLVGISYVAIPLSAAFLGLGLWLGWRQAELARGVAPAESPAAAVPVTT